MYKTIQPPCGRWKCPPLVPYGTTFPPQAGALQGSAKLCTHKSLYFKHGLFCHRLRGKSGAAGKGGGERSEPVSRMLIMPYDTESKSVTLTLKIAAKPPPQPSARRAVKLKNPWARKGPSILRTFFRNPSTQPAAVKRPQPSGRSPVNPHVLTDVSIIKRN